MRHRQHGHERFAVLLAFDRKRDDAGAIFAAFFLSTLRFVIPYIGMGNDRPGSGVGIGMPPAISDQEAR